MEKIELVSILKSQHRLLQSDLAFALENPSLSILVKFKSDLDIHLNLENGTFYPAYLEKKRQLNENIQPTLDFIKKMDEIIQVVLKFLEKYSTADSITLNPQNFKVELQAIVNTLNLRIETEEEAVYDFY